MENAFPIGRAASGLQLLSTGDDLPYQVGHEETQRKKNQTCHQHHTESGCYSVRPEAPSQPVVWSLCSDRHSHGYRNRRYEWLDDEVQTYKASKVASPSATISTRSRLNQPGSCRAAFANMLQLSFTAPARLQQVSSPPVSTLGGALADPLADAWPPQPIKLISDVLKRSAASKQQILRNRPFPFGRDVPGA